MPATATKAPRRFASKETAWLVARVNRVILSGDEYDKKFAWATNPTKSAPGVGRLGGKVMLFELTIPGNDWPTVLVHECMLDLDSADNVLLPTAVAKIKEQFNAKKTSKDTLAERLEKALEAAIQDYNRLFAICGWTYSEDDNCWYAPAEGKAKPKADTVMSIKSLTGKNVLVAQLGEYRKEIEQSGTKVLPDAYMYLDRKAIYKKNSDGTPKLDKKGEPIPVYFYPQRGYAVCPVGLVRKKALEALVAKQVNGETLSDEDLAKLRYYDYGRSSLNFTSCCLATSQAETLTADDIPDRRPRPWLDNSTNMQFSQASDGGENAAGGADDSDIPF